MVRHLLPAALAAVLAAAAPAAAQDSVFYRDVGDWTVQVDPTISNGCYATASYESGTVFRIGINPETDSYYFLVGNDAWPRLQPDGDYQIRIRFDSRSPYDVSATGLQFNPGELVYYFAQTKIYAFVEDFMARNSMAIIADGRELDKLSLRGTRVAFRAVEECQREMDASPPPPPAPPAPPPERGTPTDKTFKSDQF